MKRAYHLTKARNPCVHTREAVPNLVVLKFKPEPVSAVKPKSKWKLVWVESGCKAVLR